MWLYIPQPETSPPSASAPEAAGSTLALNWQFRRFVRSSTWRGKHGRARTWSRRWKRASWLRRLYGQIPAQPQADAFVDAWTSFLAASRASRTARQGRAGAPMTSATFGQPPAGSSSSAAHGPCSSKTSAASCTPEAPTAFIETYDAWVLRLRADFLRRRKSAPPTSAKGFSSSPSVNRDPPSLELWPTLTARDERSVYASPQTHGRNSRPLSEVAGMWATPTVADTEGGRLSRSGDRSTELLLHGQAKALHSRLDPMTSPPGGTSSPPDRFLNPLFVESLMAWPPGWTALAIGHVSPPSYAWTGCAYSETAWFRWRRRMRLELSRFALPNTLPAQLDLFG